MYPWTTTYCLIIHDRVVQYNPHCCTQNYLSAIFFPEDNIKIYDASKSTAVFSRTQSYLYQCLWICKVSSLEDTLSWKNLLLSKMDSNFLTIFLDAPIHGLFFQNLKDTGRCGWLRIVMEYNEKMECFHIAWLEVWLQRQWWIQRRLMMTMMMMSWAHSSRHNV